MKNITENLKPSISSGPDMKMGKPSGLLISTPNDIITLIGDFSCKAEKCTLDVGWHLIGYWNMNLSDYKVALGEHPSGRRKQYIWYCPYSDATFMINFSLHAETVWKVFNELRYHSIISTHSYF